jgi:dihydroneopterin aldolase
MAILAMDQYAHAIVSRLQNGKLVFALRDIASALDDEVIPVLAPYQWIREADPLPHSWGVTSDSISAWVVGQLGASRLVLVKPAGASGPGVVDPCFERFLPSKVETAIVTADRIDLLRSALRKSD